MSKLSLTFVNCHSNHIFQCNIDLQKNVLHIGTTNTTTPFLPENELPECSRLTGSPEEEAKQINETTKQLEDREIKEAIEKSKREQGEVKRNSKKKNIKFTCISL